MAVYTPEICGTEVSRQTREYPDTPGSSAKNLAQTAKNSLLSGIFDTTMLIMKFSKKCFS